jgi:hypothetical protein
MRADRPANYGAPGGFFGGAYLMMIMVIYSVFVIVGEFGAYVIGRAIEGISQSASMPAFLACFFTVFWLAWVLAVKVTEPRHS